jgi:hypothetical protein
MNVTSSQQVKPYPKYMYHRDENEPKIVMSKAEESELSTKGWLAAYIYKEYPKMVDGKIVNSYEEERRLFASQQPKTPPIEVPSFDAAVDTTLPSIETTSEDFFTEGEELAVVKETQVEGQDTAVTEKPIKDKGQKKK